MNLPFPSNCGILQGASLRARVAVCRDVCAQVRHAFGSQSINLHELDSIGRASEGFRKNYCQLHV